jgi:hypothetical protein
MSRDEAQPDGHRPGFGGRTSVAGLTSMNPDGAHGVVGTVTELRRRVCGRLALDVRQPLTMILRLAVSDMPGVVLDERLAVTHDGKPLQATETIVLGEGRSHVLQVRPGRVIVAYEATVTGQAPQPPVAAAERMIYLRPSRHAESDRLGAIARSEFAGSATDAGLLAAVSSWVGSRLSYLPGSSGPADGAVEALLAGQGGCRDHAHLVIALLRALGVPARMVAAYAPGLDPMDFHALAEAEVDGYWRAVDPTALAPRSALVRIASGRDAADTAFLSVHGGEADLVETSVSALIDGTLPADDATQLVSIA